MALNDMKVIECERGSLILFVPQLAAFNQTDIEKGVVVFGIPYSFRSFVLQAGHKGVAERFWVRVLS